MNNTAFTEAYIHEKREDRSRASRSVLRHFRVKKLQRKIVAGILGSTFLLVVFGALLLVLPALHV